jgi:hypothetical protein
MNAEVKSGFRNGLAARPDATPAKKDEMAEESRVTLPGWVLPMMVTILLAFFGNLGASLYWAGQVASNQAHMVESLVDLKSEVRQLRNENQGLREQLAGLAAAARQR